MKILNIANAVKNEVSKLLGREAILRKVINIEEYYVLDLAFSYFQRADRNRQVGYRCGYKIIKDKNNIDIYFTVVHSPIMAKFFKENYDNDEFVNVLNKTSQYRINNYLLYDGWYNGEKNKGNRIELNEPKEFIEKIIECNLGDKKTLFPKIKGQGLKNKESESDVAGNTFYLLLAENVTDETVKDIIRSSWSLFLWLYPTKPLFKRNASLNRSLNKIERKCEFRQIKKLPGFIKKMDCEGLIEAAHIKPYHLGGTDKMENGLWLCSKHHRATEGRIEGYRDNENIFVKFI